MIDQLGASSDRQSAMSLAARLDPDAPSDWRNLAAVLAAHEHAPVIGISGGQGAGKSTLARLLVAAIRLSGRSAVACSLDDFYLSRRAREELARTVHPLFATRGVPATHDLELAQSTLTGLRHKQTTRLPRFDKARDSPLAPSRWKVIAGPVSQLVFEGWCVGAPPQPEARLEEPVNRLEAAEDPRGVWRRYVNQALASDYRKLWAQVDFMIYLQVPDFAAVARWRTQQERQLDPKRRMDAVALGRFLAHYERLTLWMLETLPAQADLVVELNADHGVAGVTLGPR
ncbi:MAG: kinase [Gammaproteobacteria bacterium]|nr:kinase [Gammaproteobacteria bacterium]